MIEKETSTQQTEVARNNRIAGIRHQQLVEQEDRYLQRVIAERRSAAAAKKKK